MVRFEFFVVVLFSLGSMISIAMMAGGGVGVVEGASDDDTGCGSSLGSDLDRVLDVARTCKKYTVNKIYYEVQ